MSNILLVEDDVVFSALLDNFLQKQGYTVTVHHRVKDGLTALGKTTYDILLVDYRLPDGTGMDLLSASRNAANPPQVIIMTSFDDIRTAVRAMRSGAFDYITKPVNPDEVLLIISEALQQKDKKAVRKAAPADKPVFIEGESEGSRQLHKYIDLVAPTQMSVIIEGESGTGKEYVARTIHRLSSRSKGPFIAIDCGTLSSELAASELFGHTKGAFTGALQDKQGQMEAANGGTLFLDEVGNLSYEVQVKLLRALQERVIQPVGSTKQIRIDVRLITATNDELVNSVKKGGFREDLYHRMNEFKIKVPALRNRIADLDAFISHFRELANQELNKEVADFSEGVKNVFYTYDWPGNLRELRNAVRRAVLLAKGPVAGEETLPDEMVAANQKAPSNGYGLKAMQEVSERELIMKTLQEVKYNKAKAARLLNIDRKTLYNKLERYNIES